MILSFLVRSGVVVGAVYYTRKCGVWSDTKESEQLYNNIKNEIRPYAQDLTKKLSLEVPALPTSDEVTYVVKHYYNQGVKNSFHFIQMLPCYTGQMVKKARDAIDSFSQPPSSSTTTVATVTQNSKK